MKFWSKILLTALLVLACVCLFAACGQVSQNNPSDSGSTNPSSTDNTSANKAPLKVATDATYRPMEWQENGEITGFDVELIKAIAKQMGREVQVENVAWDNIFDDLYAGKYDVIASSVGINDERKKTMIFSDTYFNSIPLILTRNGVNIKSGKDLSKKKVAVQDSTTSQEVISKNIAGVDLKKFGGATEALEAFAKKDVDAVVLDSPVILDYVNQNDDGTFVVITDDKLFSAEQFGIVANKGNEALIAEINTALDALKNNGEYQKIYDKYFKQ